MTIGGDIMKKILLFVTTLLSTIFIYSTAFAFDLGDYAKYIAEPHDGYEMELITSYNPQEGFNRFFIGQKLRDYSIWSMPTKDGKNLDGLCEWENPDYILQAGKQNINVIYRESSINKNAMTMTFTFTINAEKFTKRIYGGPSNIVTYDAGTGDEYNVVTECIHFNRDGTRIDGNLEINNWDSSQVGTKEFNWTFTPTDSTYETKAGTIKVKFFQKAEVATEEAMTLTASKVMLTSGTKYDINIDNKDDDSTYSWTSSDSDVAKVNSKGVVTPVAKGKAVITCTVTDMEGKKKDLTSNVIVGEDDNYTSISDTDLDLEVGDIQKLTLDNKVKGSTYKWTTSNKKVAKVTTTSGKVTAIGKGDAAITCMVTTQDKEVIVLRCDVTVE